MSDPLIEPDEESDPDAKGMDTPGVLVHGANIKQKLRHTAKYRDIHSRKLINEIETHYQAWNLANKKLRGPFRTPSEQDTLTIQRRVELFSAYKEFIDSQAYAEAFDSRSNLHSSVLEEFMYYLFRDLVADSSGTPLIGKSRTFKDIFFQAESYENMLLVPKFQIERKNHDFVIGTTYMLQVKPTGAPNEASNKIEIPAVVIECKTYLDKTMLEGSSSAAEQLKARNPNAIYIVVMEWLKLTNAINIKKYKVDQIYVFRKQKNTDREFRFLEGYEKKPIDFAVVFHLYNFVRDHLTSDWGGGIAAGLNRGYLLGT